MHALAVFLAVVEHGTMTAAETEGISAAISAQVKVLERYYGTTSSSARVAGRTDGHRADRRRPCRSYPGRRAGSPGARPRGPQEWAARHRCQQYRRREFLPENAGSTPRIRMELEVRIGNTGEITAAVRRELDFAFVGSPPQDDELIAEPVSPMRSSPSSPPATLCCVRLPSTQRRCQDASSCCASVACHPRPRVALPGRRGPRAGSRHRAGSNEAVKRAVEAGLGIGLLSTHAIEAERFMELLVDLRSRVGSAAGRSGSSGVVTAATRAGAGVPGTAAAAGNGAVALSCVARPQIAVAKRASFRAPARNLVSRASGLRRDPSCLGMTPVAYTAVP